MGKANSKQTPSQPSEVNPPAKSTTSAVVHSGVNPCSSEARSEEKDLVEHHRETEEYQKVFKAYYATLCDSIPVEEMLPHLVSNDVITMQEMEDVQAERTTSRQARALLNGPIYRAISGGYPQAFVTFLCVLHSIRSCETLCEEICTKLSISTEVMTSKSRELYHFYYIFLYICTVCVCCGTVVILFVYGFLTRGYSYYSFRIELSVCCPMQVFCT